MGLQHAQLLCAWAIELSDVLADTKIIAEVWDAAGAYQIGYFPGYRWGEWNGRYRDDIRRFVKGDLLLSICFDDNLLMKVVRYFFFRFPSNLHVRNRRDSPLEIADGCPKSKAVRVGGFETMAR